MFALSYNNLYKLLYVIAIINKNYYMLSVNAYWFKNLIKQGITSGEKGWQSAKGKELCGDPVTPWITEHYFEGPTYQLQCTGPRIPNNGPVIKVKLLSISFKSTEHNLQLEVHIMMN